MTVHRRHYPRTTPVPGKPLGRLIEHDDRSKLFAFKATTPTGPIVRHSVRHLRNGSVLNQGDVGSCTGNACLGAIRTAGLVEPLLAAGPGVLPPCDEPTALALYSAATRLDSIPGSYPGQDTGSSGLAVAKAAKNAGYISGYQHALSADDALDALVTRAIIVGVDWYSSFDNPSADGECPLPAGAQVRGGHELCVDEIDVENQRVWFTNSWGLGWGKSGRAYWTWATFRKLLANDGDATIFVPYLQPAPTPTPSPVPNPGAASFPGATVAVDQRIVRAAKRNNETVTAFMNRRWASYFKIPGGA